MDVIFLHLALIYSIIFFKSKLIKKQQYLSSLRYSKSKSKSWSNCLLYVSDRSNHCIIGMKSSHILTICPYASQSFGLHLSCLTVSVKLLSCSQWDCLPANLVVSSVKLKAEITAGKRPKRRPPSQLQSQSQLFWPCWCVLAVIRSVRRSF